MIEVPRVMATPLALVSGEGEGQHIMGEDPDVLVRYEAGYSYDEHVSLYRNINELRRNQPLAPELVVCEGFDHDRTIPMLGEPDPSGLVRFKSGQPGDRAARHALYGVEATPLAGWPIKIFRFIDCSVKPGNSTMLLGAAVVSGSNVELLRSWRGIKVTDPEKRSEFLQLLAIAQVMTEKASQVASF